MKLDVLKSARKGGENQGPRDCGGSSPTVDHQQIDRKGINVETPNVMGIIGGNIFNYWHLGEQRRSEKGLGRLFRPS